MSRPIIRSFFDEPTNTVSYLVADPTTKKAAIIDPVFDYDHNSGEVDTRSVEAMLKAAEDSGNTIEWVLETHAHADHLSGAPFIKAKTGAKIGIGEHIKDVQRIFRPIFNATDLKTDGGDFDRLFRDGERFKIGELDLEVLYTPADVSYMIEDAVFFGGDAHKLYRSIKRLLALPPPRLLLPSIQVNIRAGKFPPAEANGVHYLAIPVTLKGGAEACV
jgi:glyoxylase-like metal-dependent hydrolase (beta-lactamase superfamily II)